MIATGDEELAARLRLLCNHGSRERHCHQEPGFNSRLDELQAVVLRAKLRRIDGYNAARQRTARRYSEELAEVEGVVIPEAGPDSGHVFNQYTVLVPEREQVCQVLAKRGIAWGIHYPRPLHHQPVLKQLCGHGEFPVAERVALHCLSLPIYPEISEAEIDAVVSALRAALHGRDA